MDINEAIKVAREHVGLLRRCEARGGVLADSYRRDADAVEKLIDIAEGWKGKTDAD